MIITAIVDGLGNQMFQYAAGRRLAAKTGTSLKLNVLLNTGTQRPYGLGAFNIAAEIASAAEIDALIGNDFAHKIRRRIKYHLGLGNRDPYIWERDGMPFEQALLDARHGVYMHGYWQTEKYFVDVADLIRADFTLREPMPPLAMETVALMRQTESVSLHVRRGDFAASTGPCHYSCGLDYYDAAIRRIAGLVAQPHFYLFSDDIKWATANLNLDHPCTIVSSPVTQDYEELVLMSHCRHHLIANSTFSWWGAWLDPNPTKIVIAPRQWFLPGCTYDYSNLFPDGWITI